MTVAIEPVDVFAEAARAAESRRKARDADWWKLVKGIAIGKRVSGEHIDDVLAASGKTLENLRDAVAMHQSRIQMAKSISIASGLEPEREKIIADLDLMDATLKAAVDAHNASTSPLVERLDAIRAAESHAEVSRQRLIDSCQDDEVKRESSDATIRTGELHRRRRELLGLINAKQLEAKNLAEQTELSAFSFSADKLKENKELAQTLNGEAALIEAEIPKIDREIETERAAEVKRFKRMLNP